MLHTNKNNRDNAEGFFRGESHWRLDWQRVSTTKDEKGKRRGENGGRGEGSGKKGEKTRGKTSDWGPVHNRSPYRKRESRLKTRGGGWSTSDPMRKAQPE